MKSLTLLPKSGRYPGGDPPTDEVWGVGLSFRRAARQTRHFEMHVAEETFADWHSTPEELAAQDFPIYMLEKDARVPNSIAYPLEKVTSKLRRYFTSSLSYMMALAIYEDFRRIVLPNILVMPDSAEYISQAKCLDYWCGVAEGRSIEVIVAANSCLMKPYPWQPELYGYHVWNEAADLVLADAVKRIMRKDYVTAA